MNYWSFFLVYKITKVKKGTAYPTLFTFLVFESLDHCVCAIPFCLYNGLIMELEGVSMYRWRVSYSPSYHLLWSNVYVSVQVTLALRHLRIENDHMFIHPIQISATNPTSSSPLPSVSYVHIVECRKQCR